MPNRRGFLYTDPFFDSDTTGTEHKNVIDLSARRGEEALGDICYVLDRISEAQSKIADSRANNPHIEKLANLLAETNRAIMQIGDMQADELYRYQTPNQ